MTFTGIAEIQVICSLVKSQTTIDFLCFGAVADALGNGCGMTITGISEVRGHTDGSIL